MTGEVGRRPIPVRGLRITQRIARAMAQRGLTPNMISAIGLVAGVSAGAALGLTNAFPAAARMMWLAAAVMIVIRGLANMFDGMVAVENGRGTPTGVLWNELPDRASDVALLVGAGYGAGGSPLAGWLTACLALFVAYVRTLGALAGAPADFRGPFAKQQRMFSIAGLAFVLVFAPEEWRFRWGPDDAWGPMAAVLWIMVPGISWTAVRRVRRAAKALCQTDHQ
jgi:phosphatidylglycerophosphate synthase